MKKLSIILLLFVFHSDGHAKIAILIHGYLGDAHSFEQGGALQALHEAGWEHAGNLGFSAEGMKAEFFETSENSRLYYTVTLPYKSPALLQADWLRAYIDEINAHHPDEKLSLVGHSAGGVIARTYLVQHNNQRIDQLITIATPHLGTDKAITALNATNSGGMFGFLKKRVVKNRIGSGNYHLVRQSKGILRDLLPARAGSFLHWLNNQPHPAIRYVSIVRAFGYQSRDFIVPPISQDMNRVTELAGKSEVITSPHGHFLTSDDGILLADLL